MCTTQSTALQLLLDRAFENAEFQLRQLSQVPKHDLVEIAKYSHALQMAAKDVRTLATAVAHGLGAPQTSLGAMAAAQSVTPSGLRRRYPTDILKPLAQLVEGGPVDVKSLIDSLDSLMPGDLLGIDEHLDYSIESAYGAQVPGTFLRELMPRQLAASLPRLSEILKDPKWKVSSELPPLMSYRSDATYRLLGEVLYHLSAAGTETPYRAWIDAGGRTPSIEWGGGPSIDQVLAMIIPLEEHGEIQTGIRGLRVKRFSATVTFLESNRGTENVDLRLMRF